MKKKKKPIYYILYIRVYAIELTVIFTIYKFIFKLTDVPQAFVVANNGFDRLHMFQADDRENLILTFAGDYVGISIRLKKEPLSIDQFWNDKFGKYG
jgi:hypothetical protein